MRRLMSVSLGVCVLVLASGLLPVAASASAPVRFPLTATPLLFPAGVVCPFAVLIEPIQGEAGIFPILSEGALRATLGILARTVAPGRARPAI